MNDDIFEGHGIEIELNTADDFLRIAETLTRLGIPSYKDKDTLYQSCHILHKRGRYSILHFKSLFALDGKVSTIDAADIARLNSITKLLIDWNLCKLAPAAKLDNSVFSRVKVIKHSEKHKWDLKAKYSIGTS